ncbi:MAG: hypothetical protein QNK37_03705 [Acidobacteriota bacterium]|nr:hypothetical protein [Acidobacteriota bacterium]
MFGNIRFFAFVLLIIGCPSLLYSYGDPPDPSTLDGKLLWDYRGGSEISGYHVAPDFKSLKDSNIDGVFLHRPLMGLNGPGRNNDLLTGVIAQAEAHQRVFAIEYDISDTVKTGRDITDWLTTVKQDWRILIENGLTDNPHYLRHNGKAVVVISGFGLVGKPGTPAEAADILDFFKHDPIYGDNYVIGEVPSGWWNLSGDSKSDGDWYNVYRSWDAIKPLLTGGFSREGYKAWKQSQIHPGIEEARLWGMDFLPVIWSRTGSPIAGKTSLKEPDEATYFRDQLSELRKVGISMASVAIFDERALTMRATNLTIDLGSSDITNGLTRPSPEPSDGNTNSITKGNRLCRRNHQIANHHYLYLRVNDTAAYQESGVNASITMEYFDQGVGYFRLEYDAVSSAYKNGVTVSLTGSGTWKSFTWYVNDAYFGNRQNKGSDFRIFRSDNKRFWIDKVTLSLP